MNLERDDRDDRGERARRGAMLLRKTAAVGFGLAMVAAPFLALLLNWSAGLAVMTAGLSATAWLLWDAGRHAELDQRRTRLTYAVAGVNALLALACLFVLFVVRPG